DVATRGDEVARAPICTGREVAILWRVAHAPVFRPPPFGRACVIGEKGTRRTRDPSVSGFSSPLSKGGRMFLRLLAGVLVGGHLVGGVVGSAALLPASPAFGQ